MAAHTASCRASRVRGAARLIHAFILDEDVLDRIEVRAVRRQEQQASTDSLDHVPGRGAFVGGEVVEDHDVSCRQAWSQYLPGIGREPFPCHWPVQRHWRRHARQTQPANEGRCVPMPVRHRHPAARATL